MNKESIRSLFYFVFGVDINDDSSCKKVKCVEKAYLDLCRTLRYKKDIKDNNKKKDLKDSISTMILDSIDNYPNVNENDSIYNIECSGCNNDCEKFDAWHHKLTNNIVTKCNESGLFEKDFTVGHAQKWINMTIKYLRIMGEFNEEIPMSAIHIPIDDYILSAAAKRDEIVGGFKIKGLGIKRTIESWSKIIDYKQYCDYQKEIRNKCKEIYADELQPIEWENFAWIAEAKSRKQ